MTSPLQKAVADRPAGFQRTAFEAFLESRDEPGWVTDQRRKAFALYTERLETPLDSEEFKRVDLRAFRPDNYRIGPSPPTPLPEGEGGRRPGEGRGTAGTPATSSAEFTTLLADRAKFAGSVAHVDGVGTEAVLDEKLARQGVLFGDLATLVRDHRAALEPHLMTRAVRPAADRFSAWHAAFWTGGTVLYVPRGVNIDEPLHSLIGLSQPQQRRFQPHAVRPGRGKLRHALGRDRLGHAGRTRLARGSRRAA